MDSKICLETPANVQFYVKREVPGNWKSKHHLYLWERVIKRTQATGQSLISGITGSMRGSFLEKISRYFKDKNKNHEEWSQQSSTKRKSFLTNLTKFSDEVFGLWMMRQQQSSTCEAVWTQDVIYRLVKQTMKWMENGVQSCLAEGHAAVQRHLDRLKKWADRNLIGSAHWNRLS